MSYKRMLQHRCTVLRLDQQNVNGMPVLTYAPIAINVRCFLDLTFIRKGRDPQWTPESGRPADRMGVWFGLKGADVKSGDRLLMTTGPAGTFQVQGALDDAWTPTKLHHLEYGVVETPSAMNGALRG